MKKFFSIVCMLCLTAVSAFAGITYEPDVEYTSLGDLEGKTFAIVNKAEGKALFGSNAQNLGYDVYATAFQSTNSGYVWKAELDAESGAYYLQLVTPTGADYNCWGMGGVLNSQGEPQGWECSFILGGKGTDKRGQDIQNGALYNLVYTAEGWTIKNVGTDMYQPYNNGPANSTEATYWTFCSLKEVDDGIAPETFEMPASAKALIEAGTPFYLKSGDMYLIGGDQQALKMGSWADVEACSNSTMFVLTENEDGTGLFRAITSDGSNVTAWGANPCYLNCQPATNGVLFKMNKDQDIKGGSSWIIAEAEGGYTLQNLTNKAYAGTSVATVADPVVWEFYVPSPAAEGWDGTVTTSLGETVITSISDLDNLVLTFPGAKSIEILDEEDCQYMALQNEDGSEMYGVWAPTMGSEYKIEGNQITLDGFMPMDGATTTIPVGTTKLYIEDYGTLVIDGEDVYLETIELNANIAAAAEPFYVTSVSNNGVNGNLINAVEATEGVSKSFEVTYSEPLAKGEAEATLALFEDASVNFGAATIAITETGATISFDAADASAFKKAGTYVLSIPEGVFVDEAGTPNAAMILKWVVIQGEEEEDDTYATTVDVAAGEGSSSLTDKIKIDGKEYDAYKIGTSKASGSIKVTVPAGASALNFYALSWNTATTEVTATCGEDIKTYTATGAGISNNSPYTYDAEKGGEPETHLYTYSFGSVLTEDAVITLTAPARIVFFGLNPAADEPINTDPIDMTDKIINPQFQDALNGWTLDKIATTETGGTPSTGVKGPDGNKVITAFNTTFDCQQTIEGLEAGWYKLSVQAFARPTAQGNTQKIEDNPAAFAEHTNFIYANDAQKRAMLITEDGSMTEVSGCLKLNSGLWVPTSSNTTSAIFDKGLYDQSLLFQVAEDGKAVIGVKGEIVADGGSYYAFDNFRLTRVFVADAEDVEALIAAVPEGAMDAQVKAAMKAAVEALEEEASIDNYLAAEEAIAAAKASAADYAAVKALMDSEATKAEKLEVNEAYAAAIAEVSAAYENGAIEDIEAAENVVKAAVVKAYCADMEAGKDLTALLNNTTFDNNDMNGWDVIGGLTSKNHVARSFEQNYDASQTIVGLPAGTYKVEIQLFGRGMSNNDMIAALKAGEELPSNQTYFYANEVEVEANQITSETVAEKGAGNWTEMPDGTWIPDNAAATEVVFNAGLYKQELTVEVGEDGILKVGVKMGGDHAGRYSGLDNLKLTYVGNAEPEPEIAVAIEEGEGTYTVTSTSETAALYYLCKPMSWLDEDETPESCLLSDIEGMGSMIDSEDTWEMYDHMGMEPAPKTFTVADYQEMYAGQEMFIIAANVGWNGEKLAVISNIEQINFTVPAAPEAEIEIAFDVEDAAEINPAEKTYINVSYTYEGMPEENVDVIVEGRILSKDMTVIPVGGYGDMTDGADINISKLAEGDYQLEITAVRVNPSVNMETWEETYDKVFEAAENEALATLNFSIVYAAEPEPEHIALTQDMFKEWDGIGADAQVVGDAGCALNLGVETDCPYGDTSLPENKYADLSEYSKLVVTYTTDMPRIFFNKVDQNNQPMVSEKSNTEYYTLIENEDGSKTGIVDIKAWAKNNGGFAHLNGIKASSWNTKVTVTDLYLIKEAEEELINIEIAFDVEDGAEIDLAETMSIHATVSADGVDAEDDLYVEGVMYGMDGSETPIFAYTDFEEGVNISIAHLNAGNYKVEITKVAYGEQVGMDEETWMPIFKNEVVAEEGMSLASLTFSIAGSSEPATIEIAEVQVDGTEIKVIFAEGTDLGDNYAEKPYIMAGEEKIEVKDYYTDNTTGGFFDPLNVIVITLNEELAAGEYTVVIPAGAFIVNGGENNAETSAKFTVESTTPEVSELMAYMLEGGLFSISSNGLNLNFNNQDVTWTAEASNFQFALEAPQAIEGEDYTNQYVLRIYENGKPRDFWGQQAHYLNFQPEGGSIIFGLWNNDQNGTDVKNGAVFTIEETEEGILFKNVARGLYLSANGMSADAAACVVAKYDPNATGINGIEIAAKDGKYIQNGKVVIVKNGKTYNMNGMLLK